MSAAAKNASLSFEERARHVERQLREHVLDMGRLAIVQAPPGSGKTWLLLKTASAAYSASLRVAVATQTNAQADDICRRMSDDYPGVPIVRFAARGVVPPEEESSVRWVTEVHELPSKACVVVATTAKWALCNIDAPYSVVLVDEAWQLAWADLMLLEKLADRFVLIGDPGQIPPVVTVDASRWETSPRAPHRPAPEIILHAPELHPERWSLPASRRLPSDAVDLVQPFYDFHFGAYAAPGDRAVLPAKGGNNRPADRVIDLLEHGSVAALTIPTPDAGPPLERDDDIAELAGAIVKRLLARDTRVRIGKETRAISAEDIGLVATHHVMNSALDLALPKSIRGKARVDTPERWQGLERPIMIIVHPLSGTIDPSAFDLETGRLCVMASRHQAGAIILSRDHVGETLRDHITTADQPVGRPDIAGRGHTNHLEFWETLTSRDRMLAA